MTAPPSRWITRRLGDVCFKIGSGATPRGGSGVYLDRGDVALIRSQNVHNDGFRHDGIAYLTEDHAAELQNVEVQEHDVLLNITGDSVARCCQVDPRILPARVNQHVAIIRPDPKQLDPRFLRYFLVAPDMQARMLSWAGAGGTRNALTKGMIESFEVPAPKDVREQRAIAAVLGALDDKIELNRRMCRTLEGIARAIFQAWFVDFLPVRAKAAGARSFRGMPQVVFDSLPTQFAPAQAGASPLGPIPKGWCVGTLGEHIEAVKGLSYKGSGLCDGGIPLHNLNSVHEGGGYKYEGIKYYDGEYRDRHVIRPGDIIVTNTEQGHDLLLIGYPAIVPRRFGDWGLFSHHLFRVRPKPESPVTRHFVYFMLMAPRVRDEITGHTNGTTVNMLSVTGLQMPLLVVPPRTVLDAYEAIASPLHERAEQTHDQSPTLAAIRDALLPKLVSGELRIRDVERIIGRCA